MSSHENILLFIGYSVYIITCVKSKKVCHVGSLFIIGSFSMLWGPMNHVKHLWAMTRLPFTVADFGTMFATVYFSIWVQSTFLTVIFAMIQMLPLVWYIISYIPGGQTGLKFFSKVFYAAASKMTETILPI